MPKKGNHTHLHSLLTQLTCQEILGVLETRWWHNVGIWPDSLLPSESLACETKYSAE